MRAVVGLSLLKDTSIHAHMISYPSHSSELLLCCLCFGKTTDGLSGKAWSSEPL